MSAERPALLIRPVSRAVALLIAIAYIPALTAAPGRMPADSKLYLYLDPGRFLADAAGSFDPRQFAGWVPHQHIAYLFPAGPWFWLFETLGVPDWVAHRLWLGTIMVAAGLGVRWCVRLLGASASAALAAAVVYQTSLYVLPYVSRTSVMLLPWAGLGWIVAFSIRATRRPGWGDPAAISLIVLTVGAVNATALAMIVPAPVLWLLHSAWLKLTTWRANVVVAGRVAVLSVGVSLWWVVMLMIQGKYGTDVLPYSESVADVSLTSTSAEVWRGLGYWLFYLRDPYAATTTASLRYLASSFAIFVSFLVPIVCLAGLVWTRWIHRRFAALLIVAGVILAVGVHPSDDRSPLMSLLTGGGDRGLALALRSSTRAVPLLMLGLAIAAAATIDAVAPLRLPRLGALGRMSADHALAGLIAVLAIVNLPALWTGAFVDPALERDEHPPEAWTLAAEALDGAGHEGRVLQLPGAEFGAFRWGYTVDQPLPGLTERPLVTRDLLPLGSAGAMDLLYALDDRIQQGTLDPDALAPIARLLGVDTVWLTNDQAFDRFRTARPEAVRDLVAGAEGFGPPVAYGDPVVNRPDVAVTDERSLGDDRVGQPLAPAELAALQQPGTVVRSSARSVLVSGSGDGLVDAAAAGLIDGVSVIRYSASLDPGQGELATAADTATALIVTDSNRSRARHWRGSQDATGLTEYDDARLDPLRDVTGDERLPVFEASQVPPAQLTAAQRATRTVAEQRGPVAATASSYGEPFAYLPEHRPFMAIDGDPDTAWLVGEHGDPVGELFRLYLDQDTGQVSVLQGSGLASRRITELTVVFGDSSGPLPDAPRRISLDERSLTAPGQPIELPPGTRSLDLRIDAVGGGSAGTAGAVAGVGFAEISSSLGPSVEVIHPPSDGLSAVGQRTPLAMTFARLRADPMNRWRDDPEPTLTREFDLPEPRTFEVSTTVAIDARASDAELAAAFGWPVVASTRLTGTIRHAGVAAFDGDPETTWITAFDQALGTSLAVADTQMPLADISVRQPLAGFTRITSVSLTAGGEHRTLELHPDATGLARVAVDPPLPAGPLLIEVAAIESATTVDRRFGDVVQLPAAISEIAFDGAPRLEPLGASTNRLDCQPVADIDGTPVTASLVVEGQAWLDGAPVPAQACERSVQLGAGRHLITSDVSHPPFVLNGIVLDDRARTALSAPVVSASAHVVAPGRFERVVRVDGCSEGCWLVFGEGYNPAWTATESGGSLGAPVMVDGGFNGWWLAPGDVDRLVTVRWTAQRRLTIALLLSMITAVSAIALIASDRRRSSPAPLPVPPTASWQWSAPRQRRSASIRSAAAWVLLSALLIGPSWAVWGALAAAVALRTRWARLGELTALSCVIALGAAVVLVEWRDAPFPNGGWPSAFASLHGAGMFAVVSILSGAIVADDADEVANDGQAADRRDHYPLPS